MNNRQQIIDNIISIEDGIKEIVIDMLQLEFSTNKYSAKKNSIWHLILNNKNISKRDKFYFKYNCVTCKASHMVATTQMLRKINKGSIHCDFCKNKESEKCQVQSLFMKTIQSSDYKPDPKVDIKIKSLLEIKDDCINKFESLDDDFKNNYFSYHLTDDDYKRISKNIKSFQNGKYTDINDIEYWATYNSMNQMNFTSVLYSRKNNIVLKAHQPILVCDNCNMEWRAKSIEKFKNCLKIMCKDCSFVSKTFKIRKFNNINNELILYQSKLELKFINWCNNNNILLKNGPKIPYNFENKERTYRVDFMIDKLLIEIKDNLLHNHIWHKNDIKSGKWAAKELAVNNLIKKGEYNKYYLITPLNWMDMIKQIK